MDEIRVYYNDAYKDDSCDGIGCWTLSSVCNSTNLNNLAVYFNFDECAGMSGIILT